MEKKRFWKKKIKIILPNKKQILKYCTETVLILEKSKRKKNQIVLEEKFKNLYSRFVKKYPDGNKQYHNIIKTKILFTFLTLNPHFLK